MSRSVVLYLVLLAIIIVFWVGGHHRSILLNAFNCWLLQNIILYMSRSVVLYLVLLAVIIVFWVGSHQSILLNAFNCWLLRSIISL